MSYPVFRPDLIAARTNAFGCFFITSIISRKDFIDVMNRSGLKGQNYRDALETWDALYSAGRLNDALDTAERQAPTDPVDAPLSAGEPISANEAGRRLGVSGARFRQIRKAEGIEPVGTRSGADLFDPAEVAALAISRRTDKSPVPGPDEPARGIKAA